MCYKLGLVICADHLLLLLQANGLMENGLQQQLAEVLLLVLEDPNAAQSKQFINMYQNILVYKCQEGPDQILRSLRALGRLI
jgi:hypothetical protein